jgi:shikimate kinase
MERRHVVFVGPMASGKSTIGTRVAAALDRPFLDNDDLLEAAVGMSAADLERRDGLDEVHRVEARVLLDALAREVPAVIGAAASTIEVPEVRAALLDRAWVASLRAAPGTLAARFPQANHRPLSRLDPSDVVTTQARRRDPLFAEIADATFETDRSDIDSVVADVLKMVVAASDEGRLS